MKSLLVALLGDKIEHRGKDKEFLECAEGPELGEHLGSPHDSRHWLTEAGCFRRTQGGLCGGRKKPLQLG